MSPRLARSLLETYTYFHLCARGNNGQVVFVDDQDRRRYLSLLEKYRERYGLECLAYCLMTNHVHWLVIAPSVRTLSACVHAMHVAYVMYFNRRHGRRGHLFQDRFSSWVVRDEHHAWAAREYIERNPVEAGLVTTKNDYPWSSARRDEPFVTLTSMVS